MQRHDIPPSSPVLPSQDELDHARSRILTHLPSQGLGHDEIQRHLLDDLVPGFNKPSHSPNYYGFVTGGATLAAILGDTIAVEHDQNVQVHLPKETVSTLVEDGALSMLCQLLDLQPDEWSHRIFTTGATASNVLGLACGRESVLQAAASNDVSVAELGLSGAMRAAGVEEIQILTTVPHSSLRKAASIVGLGRACVRDVGKADSPHHFDLHALEAALRQPQVASIVAVSCGEVNTGLFATDGEDMRRIRRLCDQYGAWLHVDAAFGLLARLLPPTKDYTSILQGVDGLDLADSITGDAHKLLNVPYDCGIFFSRHLALGTTVFRNTNAAYLDTAASCDAGGGAERIIPSPLNIGIENSRRFRALPVYSTLAAYGREGYRDMLERQIQLARTIARFIRSSTEFELLPLGMMEEQIYIVVLFRARDEALNSQLVRRINETRRIYVSGTVWDAKPAARFAIATWMADVDRDSKVIRDVLTQVARDSTTAVSSKAV